MSVTNIGDYHEGTSVWPFTPGWPSTYPTYPWSPITPDTGTAFVPAVTFYPEKTALQAYEDLCAAVKKMDEILGLSDVEDKKQEKWLFDLRMRVRQHELANIDKRLDNA